MQKVFWTQGAKVSEKSLAPVQNPFCTGAKAVLGGAKDFFGDLCSLGPKDLLHPPLSTFGNFPFSVNFPGPQLPKGRPSPDLGLFFSLSLSLSLSLYVQPSPLRAVHTKQITTTRAKVRPSRQAMVVSGDRLLRQALAPRTCMLCGERGGVDTLLCLGWHFPGVPTDSCPTRHFHEKYRYNAFQPDILDSQNLPTKYLKIQKKAP